MCDGKDLTLVEMNVDYMSEEEFEARERAFREVGEKIDQALADAEAFIKAAEKPDAFGLFHGAIPQDACKVRAPKVARKPRDV